MQSWNLSHRCFPGFKLLSDRINLLDITLQGCALYDSHSKISRISKSSLTSWKEILETKHPFQERSHETISLQLLERLPDRGLADLQFL